MRIIMLSDLHIGPQHGENMPPWVDHFCEFLRGSKYHTETLVFVLGDIVDKGSLNKNAAFAAAKKVFSYISSRLAHLNYKIAFIPGNHDYCDGTLDEFTQFIQTYQTCGLDAFDFGAKKAWNYLCGEVNFILADSIHAGNYDAPGQLDIDAIRQCILAGKHNILLMHHSVLFEDDYNHTGILQQEECLSFFRENAVEFVFHGHAHATRDTKLSDSLQQYGIGSMGIETADLGALYNEQEQFVEVYTNTRGVESIANWIWRSGNQKYAKSILFPDTTNLYENVDHIPPRDYDQPEKYLSRRVMLRKLATSDELTRCLNADQSQSLFDACMESQYVLLVADAGTGKTIEMKNLAFSATQKNPYVRPIFLSLNTYGGECLQDFIYFFVPEYKTLDPNQFLLIMDGYDELSHPETFKRELSRYMEVNKNTQICISMRSNFLSATSAVFKSFACYQLLELSRTDVSNELKAHNIDESAFRDECSKKELRNLIPNPFYLSKLIEIFEKDRTLPSQIELMDRIFDIQFSADASKFELALQVPLEECRYDINRALIRFAYGMQLLNCTSCSEDVYQTIVSSKEDRDYIKHSSLTINTPQGHMFSHNIFKEYLVAKYLNQLSPADIIETISVNTVHIKPEWYNVLGFVLMLNLDKGLQEWLMRVEPLVLAKLEPDRVCEDLRYSILERTLLCISDQNVWFDGDVCSLEQLATFSASSRAIDLLLQHIRTPAHPKSLYFCLSLLAEFPALYGRDNSVRAALVACYQSDAVRGHEKRRAIRAIASLRLNTPNITQDLTTKFLGSESSYERLGVYEYIIGTNQVNTCLNFLLSGIPSLVDRFSEENVSNATEHFTLVECLLNIDSPDALSEAILWFSKDENMQKSFYDQQKVIDSLLEKAVDAYNSSHLYLFDSVYQLSCAASRHFAHSAFAKTLDFFVRTNTLERMFEQTVSEDNERHPWIIDDILQIQPSLVTSFCRLYSENKVRDPDLFRRFISRRTSDDEVFIRGATLIFEKTGLRPKASPPPVNYDLLRQKDAQAFFDSLFDTDSIKKLLLALTTLYNNPEITCTQLRSAHFPSQDYPAGTHMLEVAVLQSSLQEQRVIDFIDFVDWDAFFVSNLSRILKQENTRDQLTITPAQQQVIQEVYDNLGHQLDFHVAVTECGNGYHFSHALYYYMALKKSMGFHSPDTYYLGLLEIPYHLIEEADVNAVEQKFDLIERHLSPDIIAAHIATLTEQETRISVLDDLLFGCTRYQIKAFQEKAIQVCRNQALSSYTRRNALEYLYKFWGSEIIMKEVAQEANDDFFSLIVNLLRSTHGNDLIPEIIRRYKRTSSLFLLENLIVLSPADGLPLYIDAARAARKTIAGRGEGFEVTKAISSVRNITLLPHLLDLVRLRFSDGFEDTTFYTLYSSLQNALSACAEQNFKSTWESIDAIKEDLHTNLDAVGFCSTLQKSMMVNYMRNQTRHPSAMEVRAVLNRIS